MAKKTSSLEISEKLNYFNADELMEREGQYAMRYLLHELWFGEILGRTPRNWPIINFPPGGGSAG